MAFVRYISLIEKCVCASNGNCVFNYSCWYFRAMFTHELVQAILYYKPLVKSPVKNRFNRHFIVIMAIKIIRIDSQSLNFISTNCFCCIFEFICVAY